MYPCSESHNVPSPIKLRKQNVHFRQEIHEFYKYILNSFIPGDRFVITPAEETFVINHVKIDTPGKIHMESCNVRIAVDIVSYMPRPVLSNSVEAAILPYDHHLHTAATLTATNFPVPPGWSGTVTPGPGSKNNKHQSNKHINKKSQLNPSNKGQQQRGSNSELEMSGKQNSNADLGNTNSDGDDRERISRKESASLTCQDEDNLAIADANPSTLRLHLMQQLDTKQDKSVHMGRLMCHNIHQALRSSLLQMISILKVLPAIRFFF